MEADKHFLVCLLPAVQLASCVEDKYKILADGIFNFFSSRYGCHRRKEKIIASLPGDQNMTEP